MHVFSLHVAETGRINCTDQARNDQNGSSNFIDARRAQVSRIGGCPGSIGKNGASHLLCANDWGQVLAGRPSPARRPRAKACEQPRARARTLL